MEYGTQGSSARSATGRSAGETETKQAFKTTEFWIYVVILFCLLIAGLVSDAGSEDAIDGFGAERVWLYAVLLSIGYMISRGLAKSGTRAPDVEGSTSGSGESLGDRAKAAAQVLKGETPPSSSTAPTQQVSTTDEPRY